MKGNADRYDQFVDHPRFGSHPNFTGLNPDQLEPGVHIWDASIYGHIVARFESITGKKWPFRIRTKRISGTAIAANLSRQTPATVPATHYFDLEQQCRDCKRMFIFFAAEQKYWFEELGFGLTSKCVRCVECRKLRRGIYRQREIIARQRKIYESLFHVIDKTEQQALEMADACLYLIEHDVFTIRRTERVRMLLNLIPEDSDIRKRSQFSDLIKRLPEAEARGGKQTHAPEQPAGPVSDGDSSPRAR
jgi:hypothetical protein